MEKLQAPRNFTELHLGKACSFFLFKESFSPLISRIHPSTPQAPPNIRQSEMVISLQLVIIEKFSISATKL